MRSEVHTGLLWVFEGITSYYDHLVLVRAGLITTNSYLAHIARAITSLTQTRGRLRQTIEASSFDAWTHFYRQDANSSNALVSYYTKGSLVALALDLTLRKESKGKCTQDDVMREVWSQYGESSEGMPERGLETIAREVSGLELADFFERFVRGTIDLPLQGLLREVGVDLRMRPANDSKDKGGIAPGDLAVALDDLQLNAANLDERLKEHHVGDTVTISAFRDEHLMKFRVKLAAPPEDTCYLELASDPDTETETMRTVWLTGD